MELFHNCFYFGVCKFKVGVPNQFRKMIATIIARYTIFTPFHEFNVNKLFIYIRVELKRFIKQNLEE